MSSQPTPDNQEKESQTYIAVSKEKVLELLGGEWPDSGDSASWPSGFSWEFVSHFVVEEGELVPYAGGLPAPGPNLRLSVM